MTSQEKLDGLRLELRLQLDDALDAFSARMGRHVLNLIRAQYNIPDEQEAEILEELVENIRNADLSIVCEVLKSGDLNGWVRDLEHSDFCACDSCKTFVPKNKYEEQKGDCLAADVDGFFCAECLPEEIEELEIWTRCHETANEAWRTR